MIRVGIIGGGFIGRQHAAELGKAGAEVVAVAEPVEEKRAEFQKDMDVARGYPDGLELIEREKLDAVSVCGPNYSHHAHTVAALRAGMNVLCEKPMAMNRNESAEMVRVAEDAGKLLMMAFNQLFDPGIMEMMRLAQRGDFGDVYHARSSQLRRAGSPAKGREWFVRSEQAGGGVSFDLGAHVFYRTWYAMGMPTPVSVTAATHQRFVRGDVDDFATALVRFSNGASMVLETAWDCARTDTGKRTMVMGSRGGASFWTEGKEFVVISRDNDEFHEEQRRLNAADYRNKYQHFTDCLKGETQCMCPGTHGHLVQCVLDALLESARTGSTVAVEVDEV